MLVTHQPVSLAQKVGLRCNDRPRLASGWVRPCLKIEKEDKHTLHPSLDFACVYSVHTGIRVCTPHPTYMKVENSGFEIALSYSMKSVLWGFRITETEVFCTELKGLPVKSSIFKSRDTQKGCRTAASAYSGNHVRIELTRQRRGQRHGQLCSHLLLQWSTSFPAFSMFSGNPISHPPWIIKSWLLKNLV